MPKITADRTVRVIDSFEVTRIVQYDDGACCVTYLWCDNALSEIDPATETSPYFALPNRPFYSYHDCPLPEGYEWKPFQKEE